MTYELLLMKKRILANANAADISTSKILHELGLNKEIKAPKPADERRLLVSIANNLNQVARRANSGHDASHWLPQLTLMLTRLNEYFMIAKTTVGSDFEGALTYGAGQRQGRKQDQAELLITSNVREGTPQRMAREMQLVASESKRIEKAVWHTSLSWPPGEQVGREQNSGSRTVLRADGRTL